MAIKLTLTLDKTVINKAKKCAKTNDQSISKIIENYLKMLTSENDYSESGLPPITKSLKGAFTAPPDFDYKKELTKVLEKKYIKNG